MEYIAKDHLFEECQEIFLAAIASTVYGFGFSAWGFKLI